jgi:ribosomal protein S18 acetylase RimI-like enzyme
MSDPRIVIAAAADAADVAAVADLFREYVFSIGRTQGIDVGYQDFAGEMETFPARYELLLLARVDGAAAAALALKRLDGEECEMKRLYCRDAFRGLQLGQQLVARLIEDARRRGYRTMRLDTHASMGPAIRLYESFGFLPSPPHNEPGNACTMFFAKAL